MKNFIIIFLFFNTNITLLNAQWEECNNCPECSGGRINGDAVWCFAIDGNNTYTGITGGVFMTTDYGAYWTAKNKGLTITLMPDTSISSLAVNENNIFAGTGIDGIFRSTDKGENWVQKSNGLSYDSVHLAIIHTLKINGNDIFTGTNKGIFVSSDNGENWIPKNNGLPQKIGIFSFAISGNNIFAGTRYGVYMTSDNGDNWSPKNKDMDNLIILSLTTSGNIIYAGTEFGGLFLSNDQGENWENIGFEGYTITEIISIGNNIIVSGNGINLSIDNGKSWTPKNSGLPSLRVISMIINGDHIFAGIDNYGIYRAKLSDLGITDVKEPEQKNEKLIYPNPTSDKITIEYPSELMSNARISIFDCLGTELLTQNTYGKRIEFDCSPLPNGIYFYVVKSGSKAYSGKFVVLK